MQLIRIRVRIIRACFSASSLSQSGPESRQACISLLTKCLLIFTGRLLSLYTFSRCERFFDYLPDFCYYRFFCIRDFFQLLKTSERRSLIVSSKPFALGSLCDDKTDPQPAVISVIFIEPEHLIQCCFTFALNLTPSFRRMHAHKFSSFSTSCFFMISNMLSWPGNTAGGSLSSALAALQSSLQKLSVFCITASP